MIEAVPLDAGEGHGLTEGGAGHPAEHLIAAGPVRPRAASPLRGTSSTSSHDDEVFEVSEEAVVLAGGDFELDIVTVAPDVRSPRMRPWALRTKFQARALGPDRYGVVDHPLNQRKRSSPRTATRRSQPRS